MGTTKVLLDTNIIISALGWAGKPREIFQKCLSGELELITSLQQLDELMRVMDYPKFNFSEEQKLTILGIITAIATIVEITGQMKMVKEDPDDDAILETAMVGEVSYIISGDPHLLNLKAFIGIKMMTASEFLERKR